MNANHTEENLSEAYENIKTDEKKLVNKSEKFSNYKLARAKNHPHYLVESLQKAKRKMKMSKREKKLGQSFNVKKD